MPKSVWLFHSKCLQAGRSFYDLNMAVLVQVACACKEKKCQVLVSNELFLGCVRVFVLFCSRTYYRLVSDLIQKTKRIHV